MDLTVPTFSALLSLRKEVTPFLGLNAIHTTRDGCRRALRPYSGLELDVVRWKVVRWPLRIIFKKSTPQNSMQLFKKTDDVGLYVTRECIRDLLMNAKRDVFKGKHRMLCFVKPMC